MLVEAKAISKLFPASKGLFGAARKFVCAVDEVNLSIESGHTLALVGESGSGKTTLGRIVAGLLKPTTGTVQYGDFNIINATTTELRKFRKHVQYVFQDPYSALNPRHTVQRILRRPFEVHTQLNSMEIDHSVNELLDMVGLKPPEQVVHRYPHQFSGGQRQRLVLARAIALRPKFIVADEPVSSVDMSVKAQLLKLLQDFQAELNLTYLFITHELSVVPKIAKDIAVMYQGRIVEMSPVIELYQGPLHPYSALLLSATPSLDPNMNRQRLPISPDLLTVSSVEVNTGCAFRSRCQFVRPICHKKQPLLRAIGTRRVACHFVGHPNFASTRNLPESLRTIAASHAEAFLQIEIK
jgi:oligopeptide/dipeptide ABC transporter ATP-binding protein